MERNPHVVRVISTFGVGGIQKQLTKVAPLLLERGYRITVLALEGDGPLREQLERDGAETTVMPLKGKYRLGEILKLAKWLADSRCHILHVHRMGGVVFPALLAGRIAGVKAMVVHHHFPYTWQSRRKRLLEAFATKLAAQVIGVSEHVAKNSTNELSLPPQKVKRIYNGVERTNLLSPEKARERLRLPLDKKVCGLVARIVYFKRIQDAIEAMETLNSKRRDTVLALVGDGEARRVKALKEQSERLRVNNSVVWCGEVANAAELARGFDVGMLVSTKEGLGNTVLEYWAAGIPVVATIIPPIAEMVSTGGILVPPKSPKAIAEAVNRLLSSPKLKKRLGLQGRTRVARFSIERTAESTHKLYRELLTA